MAVDLKNHPGLNPEYFREMEYREIVKSVNRERKGMKLAAHKLPPQPNKYRPHIGAKQRAKFANWPDGKMHRTPAEHVAFCKS